MSQETRPKVPLPQSARKEVSSIKFEFLQLAQEQANNIEPAERAKFKSLLIEYINLILKEQRDSSEYHKDYQQENSSEKAKQEELFQQKCELMEKVLMKKMEQCRATTPTAMSIEIDTSLPESLFVMKNGAEVPIQSELNFETLESYNQKIQALHEKQSHHCNVYREIMDIQKWNANTKI